MKANESEAKSPLNDAIIAMEKNLVDWRESLNSNDPDLTQKHLDDFILAAREGLRLMALKHGHDPETADDIAVACTLKLLKCAGDDPRPPFSPLTIDALVNGKEAFPKIPGLPGSVLAGYLYGMLSNYVTKQDHQIKNKKLRAAEYQKATAAADEGEYPLMGRPDNVIRNVSNSLNTDMITKIHDDYLDHTLHKGQPLRLVFGAWTPMLEWTGECDKKARPKSSVISETQLRRHMDAIKDLIVAAKNATLPFGSGND